MVDFNMVNNKRHLDIAFAALVHVNYGSPLLRKVMSWVIKRWSKQCELGIDEEWVKSCKGLIAGDWTHFASHGG